MTYESTQFAIQLQLEKEYDILERAYQGASRQKSANRFSAAREEFAKAEQQSLDLESRSRKSGAYLVASRAGRLAQECRKMMHECSPAKKEHYGFDYYK